MIRQTSLNAYLFFVRAYPVRSWLMLGAFVLAGLVEGIGAAGILSLLSLLLGEQQSSSVLARAIHSGLEFFGITATIVSLLSLMVLVSILKSALTFLAMALAGFTSAHVAADMRVEMMRALLKARWSFFVHHPIGESANAVATEAQRAAQVFLSGSQALASLVLVLVYAAVSLLVSWRVSLLALLAGGILAFTLRFLIGLARKAGVRQTKGAKALTRSIINALSGLKAVKAMGREQRFESILEQEALELRDTHRKQVIYQQLMPLISEPLMLIIVAVGLSLAIRYTSLATSELLVLGLLALRLMQRISVAQSHFQRMAVAESALWSLQKAKGEAKQAAEIHEGRTPPRLEQKIELRDVTFGYAEQPVIYNLSFDIPARKFVALYGPSGTGKTTLVDLVIGLHRPSQGEVYLDGTPLSKIDLRLWRHQIGYVPQETYLFQESIAENVTLGDRSIGDDKVKAVLKAAGAWDFIAAMPDGMHTVVGEGGGRLSGGQRQRIAIARALAADPLLLVLDEATAALDPHLEREILKTIRTIAVDVTVLAVSHQPAVAEAADIIYDLTNLTTRADGSGSQGKLDMALENRS